MAVACRSREGRQVRHIGEGGDRRKRGRGCRGCTPTRPRVSGASRGMSMGSEGNAERARASHAPTRPRAAWGGTRMSPVLGEAEPRPLPSRASRKRRASNDGRDGESSPPALQTHPLLLLTAECAPLRQRSRRHIMPMHTRSKTKAKSAVTRSAATGAPSPPRCSLLRPRLCMSDAAWRSS